jgi:hypothetical protein
MMIKFSCCLVLTSFDLYYPNISVHDDVEEENLPEHDKDDDASQAEVSQPHNRAVQSITTEHEVSWL